MLVAGDLYNSYHDFITPNLVYMFLKNEIKKKIPDFYKVKKLFQMTVATNLENY